MEDAPDEYKELALEVVLALGRKDFAAFVQKAMVRKEQLRSMMEAGWQACPEMAPSEEARPAAYQLLADYQPRGEAVKRSFDDCFAKHDFSEARYQSARAREHMSFCGGEMADHVVVVLTMGKGQAVVVLDDLVKTEQGWRLVDAGISCAQKR